MASNDEWEPESEYEFDDNTARTIDIDPIPLEREGNAGNEGGSLAFKHDGLDSLQKLTRLVHSVKFQASLADRYLHRDFAELSSTSLARGNYSQTRKVSGISVLAKHPIIHLSKQSKIEASRSSFESAALELRILLHDPLREHENIVDIISIGWTRPSPETLPCLPVTYVEFASHGTLARYLKEKTVDAAVKNSLLQDVALGLHALHSCGITHGDLKTDNVLVFPTDEEPYKVRAKLSDFGSSVLDDENGVRLRGCTPPWNAPEWEKRFSPSLLHVTDLYSFGLLTWSVCLDGKIPFEGQDTEGIEAQKLSDTVLDTAISDLEQQYDITMLLRGSVDDDSRFFAYYYHVAIPRKVLQNTLRFDHRERSLERVLEVLSPGHYYGYQDKTTDFKGEKIEETRVCEAIPRSTLQETDGPFYHQAVVSFIAFFDTPNYVRVEVLKDLRRMAEDENISDRKRGEALLQLCWAYIDGFGADQDIDAALDWLEKAVLLGDIFAGGLMRRIFAAAGREVPEKLRSIEIGLLEQAVRWGLSISRYELQKLDVEKCTSAEEEQKVSFGAAMPDDFTIPQNFTHFLWIDGLFHPRNRAVFRQVHAHGVPWLSLEQNNYAHAGAAMGVDIENFDSFLKDFPNILNQVNKSGNSPLHVALRCNNAAHAKSLLRRGANAGLMNKRGESPCHFLVYLDHSSDQEEVLDLLLQNGATLGGFAKRPSVATDPYSFVRGGTPLHWAVERNKIVLSKALLDHGADPEIIYLGRTPIDIAVEKSYPEILEALLIKAHKPPISTHVLTSPTERDAEIPLNRESYVNFAIGSVLLHDRWLDHGSGWLQCVKQTLRVLRRFGLDTKTKNSPMMVAAYQSTGGPELLEMLVDEGFAEGSHDDAGLWQHLFQECVTITPPLVLRYIFQQYLKCGSPGSLESHEKLLLKGVEGLNFDASVAEMVLATGISVDCHDSTDRTAFMLAVKARNYEVATFLLSRGADPTKPCSTRWNKITQQKHPANILYEYVMSNNDLDLGPLKYLLEPLHPYVDRIPHFWISEEGGKTVLHFACQTGNVNIVEYLLQKFPSKSHVDAAEDDGYTALHYATFYGHLVIVKLLCNAGADINAQLGPRNKPRRERATVLDFCYFKSAPSTANIDQNHGLQMTQEDVFLNRLQIADFLQVLGARRADRKLVTRSLACILAAYASIGMPKVLVECLRRMKSSPVFQNTVDALLFEACKRENTQVVQHLLDAGADINTRSKHGLAPLHCAVYFEQIYVLHLLIKKGAEVNPFDEDDETPLSYALKKKSVAAVRALKEAGGVTPIPRKIFNKMFTDMGVDPPNIPAAELPRYTFKLEGEPTDDDSTDKDDSEDAQSDGADVEAYVTS